MRKRIAVIALAALAVLFLLSLMPWGWAVCVQTTAYEYALDQEEPLRTHEVTIEGRYTFRIWSEDDFDGILEISGIADTLDAPAKVQFRPGCDYGMISYRDWAGQPHMREPQYIYCDRDFSQFAIMLFEQERDGDRVRSHWSADTGRVLCANAPNYETLKSNSKAVGFHIWSAE